MTEPAEQVVRSDEPDEAAVAARAPDPTANLGGEEPAADGEKPPAEPERS